MRWWLNDLRLWALLALGCLLAGLGWALNRAQPLPVPLDGAYLQHTTRALDLRGHAPALEARMAPTELEALAARVSAADTPLPNPWAGRTLAPQRVEGVGEVVLPEGLAEALAPHLEGDPVERALGALRLPESHVDDPVLIGLIEARVSRGMKTELEAWGALLAQQAALAPRPRVLLAGLGQARLGGALDPLEESEVYAAWIDALAAWFVARDMPAEVWTPGFSAGRWQPASEMARLAYGAEQTWHPSWYDLEGHLEAVAAGTAPDTGPLVDLGRLRAIELFARADLLDVVFAGHGRVVRDPVADAARFAGYTTRSLQEGDACQELTVLRSRTDGARLRLGICLGRGDPHLALSCSNAWEGRSAPQHNTAAVRHWLARGAMPPFDLLEPAGFRLFAPLQTALREAEGPAAVRAAVGGLLRAQAEAEDPVITDVISLVDGAWLVRVGDAASPDLLIAGPELQTIDPRLDQRLEAASTAWSRVEPRSVHAPAQVRERLRPCGDTVRCEETLDQLAGPVPTELADARALTLDGREVFVVADPDATQQWVRLAVLQGVEESDADWLSRAQRLRQAIRSRRVQGLVLPPRTPEPPGSAPKL